MLLLRLAEPSIVKHINLDHINLKKKKKKKTYKSQLSHCNVKNRNAYMKIKLTLHLIEKIDRHII